MAEVQQLSTREGGQQDHSVTSGGREEPISRARGGHCLLPSCHPWNTHPEVTAFSLEAVASQTQAAEARLPPPGLPVLAGPSGIGSAPPPGSLHPPADTDKPEAGLTDWECIWQLVVLL